MHRGIAPNVLLLCASAAAGEAVSAAAQNSAAAVFMESILAAGFSFIGFVTLFLRPLGMGLWSHGLSCTRSRLIQFRPLVLLLLRAFGTTITWHRCTPVPGRAPRQLAEYWVSRSGLLFKWFSGAVGYGCPKGLHIVPFTLALARSRSLGMVILMCFLWKTVFLVFSLCPPQLLFTPASYFTPSVNAVSECRWYEFPEEQFRGHWRRGGSLHSRADHGLHGDRTPWPPGRGEMGMDPFACCLPCQTRMV